MVRAYVWIETSRKKMALVFHLSWSPEVIESDTYLTVVWDILLMIHRNYGPISYSF